MSDARATRNPGMINQGTAAVHFCGTQDAVSGSGQLARNPHARWLVASTVPGVPLATLQGLVAQAMDRWAAVAAVTHEMLASSNAGAADLVVNGGKIDGPFGVLAWTELPGPQQQQMRLDNAETWEDGQHGHQRNSILLANVLTHELGHFWGLEHLSSGNLMQPTYDPQIVAPQSGDIEAMVQRYGPAAHPEPPPGPSTPPDVPLPSEPGSPALMRIYDSTGTKLATYRIQRIEEE